MKTQHLHLLVVVLLLLPQAVKAQFEFLVDIFNALIGFFCLLPILNLFCNDCDPDPCSGNGVCTDQVGGFTCMCNDEFAGDTCDDEVESCGLLMDWDVECILAGNGPQAGLDCESPLLGYIECLDRPTAATMLFTGGGCEQGDNTQSSSEYTCTDSNSGPPSGVDDRAYIVVTDINGAAITYFSGPVSVGETFSLNDGNQRFVVDMFIMIYTPDQQTLLQMVQFDTSCSSALHLLDRFGAAQLVGFFNDRQGGVSVSTVYSLALTFNVPADADFDPTEFTSMTAETSWAGEVDWTDQVADQVIAPGGNGVTVTQVGPSVGAGARQPYDIIVNIEATWASNGETCAATELGISLLKTFFIGYDPTAK